MAKEYQIKLTVDASQADQATAKQQREQEKLERQAFRTVEALERADKRAADAKIRESKRAADQQARDTQRIAAAQARADDAVTREVQRQADGKARIEQRAQDRLTAMAGRALTAEESRARASGMIHQRANDRRVAMAVKAMTAEQNAAKGLGQRLQETMAAAGKGGEDGALGFLKMAAALGAVKSAASIAGDALAEADRKARGLAGRFVDNRDKLAELATVMGEKADNAFTIRNAEFNAATGLRDDEGLAFRMQFQNAGAQHKGTKISDAEYGQYEQQAAQLAAAKGFDPSQVGELAGSLLGFKDRQPLGNQASEDAVGKLNSGLAILGRGKGRNSVLQNQFSMLSAASLNEDELMGTFTDSDEVAAVISVMAEKHDASAAEMARAANRGLRDFDGKAADLLKKAGVTAKTKFVDAIKAITPLVEAEAKARGVKVEDVLKGSFEDVQTREGIGVAINKGIKGGLFEDRLNFGRQNAGPAPALQAIGEFAQNERGQHRLADARLAGDEAIRGAEDSTLTTLRKQAEARLVQRREIDTTGGVLMDMFRYVASGTLVNGRNDRIDFEAAKMLNERLGEKVPNRAEAYLPLTTEERSAHFNREFAKARGANIDPLTGGPLRGADAPVPEAMQVRGRPFANPFDRVPYNQVADVMMDRSPDLLQKLVDLTQQQLVQGKNLADALRAMARPPGGPPPRPATAPALPVMGPGRISPRP